MRLRKNRKDLKVLFFISLFIIASFFSCSDDQDQPGDETTGSESTTTVPEFIFSQDAEERTGQINDLTAVYIDTLKERFNSELIDIGSLNIESKNEKILDDLYTEYQKVYDEIDTDVFKEKLSEFLNYLSSEDVSDEIKEKTRQSINEHNYVLAKFHFGAEKEPPKPKASIVVTAMVQGDLNSRITIGLNGRYNRQVQAGGSTTFRVDHTPGQTYSISWQNNDVVLLNEGESVTLQQQETN